MIIEALLLLVGVYLIVKGSDWITDAAVPLAERLNTTNVAVGLVLVSVLLSLPELLIALMSIAKDHIEIGIGASLGSIIVNLGLIVGISAMIKPLKIPRHVITRDAVFMLVITIVVALIALKDFSLTQRDGIVFLLLFIPYLVNVYEQEKTMAQKERKRESDMITKTLFFIGKTGGPEIVFKDSRLIFLGGALMLIIGTQFFTDSLISIAKIVQLPELLIGLTLGALGPSIPNLVAAVQAVRKNYVELAVSETIGSNIFTLLITLGIIAIAHPFTLDPITAVVTTPAMVLITILFFMLTMRGTITRVGGAALLTAYLATLAVEFLIRVKF
jgi:cation:H+ antiporter